MGPGCARDINERELASERSTAVALDETLSVRVEGGAVVESVAPTGRVAGRVVVLAQSFEVRIYLEDAGCDPRTVDLEVVNLPSGEVRASRRAFLAAIDSEVDATREAAGWGLLLPADGLAPNWTPLEPERGFAADRTGAAASWRTVTDRGALAVATGTVPPDTPAQAPGLGACVARISEAAGPLGQAPLVVRHRIWRAPPEGAFSFAVVGNHGGGSETRRALYAAIETADPPVDFVVISGDLTRRGSSAQINDAAADLATFGRPWFATVGERDIAGGAGARLVRAFGALTFSLDVGDRLRVIVLDSAESSLSARSYRLLGQWLADGPATKVVITHFPPFDVHGMRGAGFKHLNDAARFIGALRRADVGLLVTSHLALYEEQTIAGVRVVHSGGGGAKMEAVSGDAHHWLRVDVAADGALTWKRRDL